MTLLTKFSSFPSSRSFEVENLKRINVFTGRNNSGKFSLLESLYLASVAFSFEDVLRRDRLSVRPEMSQKIRMGVN